VAARRARSRRGYRPLGSWAPVCTENPVRIDCVTESRLNVSGDDRALLALPGRVRLAVQVKEPTCGRERGAPTSIDRAARRVRGGVQLTNGDRLFLVTLYRWFPSVLKVITIVRPETLVRWHRAGFRRYWRWKSRSLGGRPKIDADVRALIRRMSAENPLWGAPRIHGELLKLGFEVSQSSVAKYMVKRCGPPSQGWCNSSYDRARGPLTCSARSMRPT
jgi:hypothetical protein